MYAVLGWKWVDRGNMTSFLLLITVALRMVLMIYAGYIAEGHEVHDHQLSVLMRKQSTSATFHLPAQSSLHRQHHSALHLGRPSNSTQLSTAAAAATIIYQHYLHSTISTQHILLVASMCPLSNKYLLLRVPMLLRGWSIPYSRQWDMYIVCIFIVNSSREQLPLPYVH